MWGSVVNIVYTGITSAFGWFDRLIDSIPGSWNTVLSFFVMIAVTRFILGSLVGTGFAGGGLVGFLSKKGSDTVKRSRGSTSASSSKGD